MLAHFGRPAGLFEPFGRQNASADELIGAFQLAIGQFPFGLKTFDVMLRLADCGFGRIQRGLQFAS